MTTHPKEESLISILLAKLFLHVPSVDEAAPVVHNLIPCFIL